MRPSKLSGSYLSAYLTAGTSVYLAALVFMVVVPVAVADSAAVTFSPQFAARDATRCGAASPKGARSVAEQLMNLREYQRAGGCYLAAGDYTLADLAFIKAVDPATAALSRQLAENRDVVKAQSRSIMGNLHRAH